MRRTLDRIISYSARASSEHFLERGDFTTGAALLIWDVCFHRGGLRGRCKVVAWCGLKRFELPEQRTTVNNENHVTASPHLNSLLKHLQATNNLWTIFCLQANRAVTIPSPLRDASWPRRLPIYRISLSLMTMIAPAPRMTLPSPAPPQPHASALGTRAYRALRPHVPCTSPAPYIRSPA
jgi:hypothetical protein